MENNMNTNARKWILGGALALVAFFGFHAVSGNHHGCCKRDGQQAGQKTEWQAPQKTTTPQNG
jgi:hypothetical protein